MNTFQIGCLNKPDVLAVLSLSISLEEAVAVHCCAANQSTLVAPWATTEMHLVGLWRENCASHIKPLDLFIAVLARKRQVCV